MVQDAIINLSLKKSIFPELRKATHVIPGYSNFRL